MNPPVEYQNLMTADSRYNYIDPRAQQYTEEYEVRLQTLCGCTKIMQMSSREPAIRVVFNTYRLSSETLAPYVRTEVTRELRTFVRTGNRDQDGRYIYLEDIRDRDALHARLETAERKYRELWQSVYAMDEGL